MLSKDEIDAIHEFIGAFNEKIDLILIYESLRMHRAHIETKIAKATLIRREASMMDHSLARKRKADKKLEGLRAMHDRIMYQMEIIRELIERR